MRLEKSSIAAGRAELRSVRRRSRGLFWFVAIVSVFANLLMLTGPIYMLQIYDRVLSSRSVETLIALSVLVVFLYTVMGVLDFARGRVMGRVGARFQTALDRRVFDAVIRKSALVPDALGAGGLRDLEAVQRLMSAPVVLALFDMPWAPVFIAAIWVFHPWLGALAIVGGALLIALAVLNQVLTRRPAERAARATLHAEAESDRMRHEAEAVQAMGMRDAAFARWQRIRDTALRQQLRAADLGGSFTSTSKAFRLLLQSAMLGLGAFLVLRGEITAGAMIAGSILLGRALAPVEMALGSWPLVQRAMQGWENLAELLGEVPPETPRTALPRPRARLEVQQLGVLPPGERVPVLRAVSFSLSPGQALGIIGPSGAGKSTLARALTGVWRPAAGTIRLDGATLDQYEPAVLGGLIGYLPQRVQLFDGTIAENIARLAPAPDAAEVVKAAKRADAHAMILRLPEGYDTRVSAAGGRLSGGEIQRIGLARAMYGDPVILVLDEPNANLDNAGSEAVNRAIRGCKSSGRAVIVVAHRPSVIRECDLLVMLEQGQVRAFGPRDEVLRGVVKNHEALAEAARAADGAR
ncbi:MAG: type I secretion system permease/ATPase [Roseovarius sp.]|nr:type I secretion system permease/ATPase [Roseovarius sp.]